MLVRAYAKALNDLVARGMREDEAYQKLAAHLKETGRLKLLPQLARELRIIAKRQESHGPTLEVASAAEAKSAETAAKEAGHAAKAVVNPDLISGWRLTTGAETLTDRSGKRALIELYRRITNY